MAWQVDRPKWATLSPQQLFGGPVLLRQGAADMPGARQYLFFIDNLLVRIHLIIEMILVDRPQFPFPGSLISTFLAGGGCLDVHVRVAADALRVQPSTLNPKP